MQKDLLEWHRQLCSIVGGIAWALYQRKVSPALLHEWASDLEFLSRRIREKIPK